MDRRFVKMYNYPQSAPPLNCIPCTPKSHSFLLSDKFLSPGIGQQAGLMQLVFLSARLAKFVFCFIEQVTRLPNICIMLVVISFITNNSNTIAVSSCFDFDFLLCLIGHRINSISQNKARRIAILTLV